MTILQIKLRENLFLKDPQSTELGRKIIKHGIAVIDELGFEAFTFKKLSAVIHSTEASIYRYFENKHRLLVYLISWYWQWLEYRISFECHNIADPRERLAIALRILCERKENDPNFQEIDESALQRIVIAESDKTYLIKDVDEINKEGIFRGYKSLCGVISKMVQEVNSNFPLPHALVSTVVEASNQQIFFAQHLPSLTELSKSDDPFQGNIEFVTQLVFNSLNR